MLRPKDNLGGVRSDPGQEQPPRPGAEHAVHPLEQPGPNQPQDKHQPKPFAAIRIYFVKQLSVTQVVDLALFIIFKLLF